jgi:hypothetical protein
MLPIKSVSELPFTEVEKKLRRVHLSGQPEMLIYKNAKIHLEKSVDPKEIKIAQKYVLREQLERIVTLRNSLLGHGYDIFDISGYLHVECGNGYEPEVFDVLPPVVEWSPEDDVWLLNDGMHRMFLALTLNRRINCIFISNILDDLPYYAYPSENGWDGVEVLDCLTKNTIKKKYRIENYRTLFRDFNSSFTNVTKIRQAKGE